MDRLQACGKFFEKSLIKKMRKACDLSSNLSGGISNEKKRED